MLGLAAAVFAISMLLAALVVVVLSLLKSVITGHKPAPPMVFARFQKFSKQGVWPGGMAQPSVAKRGDDIADVEVREIRDDKPHP